MTAQPADRIPASGPDTGLYEVIHRGGQAAVVVVSDFLRLQALQQVAQEPACVAFRPDTYDLSAGTEALVRSAPLALTVRRNLCRPHRADGGCPERGSLTWRARRRCTALHDGYDE
jgi:hypothetical protein